MTITMTRSGKHLTFEDLNGLRAEGYVRDSTLDQRDGFGPDLQRRAVENFASTYGITLGTAWYTDFISGTSTLKRSAFRQALADAQSDRFDVLLVYHTSRFARNRADAIRYKADLKKLGKTLIFVSQGIISGNDDDFLNEGINEVLDEHYSRNLSRWVADGLRVKHESGITNGVPSLGYKSQKLDNGKRETKVPAPETMPALLALLRSYASGRCSYETTASLLNSQGYRNRQGELFTKGSVEHVLSNRFYVGQAVYHPGEPDEEVRDGTHEVPEEVRTLWLQCQEVKRQRATRREGRPRSARRAYPFSMVAICDNCAGHYSGQPVLKRNGQVVRRLCHKRPFCELKPHSVRVEHVMGQFQEGVLPYVALDQEWRQAVLGALCQGEDATSHEQERTRLERALINLRKQHLWGDIDDRGYHEQKTELERRLKACTVSNAPAFLVNVERAAQLLADLPGLWSHPGVTDNQRELLVKEVLQQARLRGGRLVAVEPRVEYQPLFACIVMAAQGVRKSRGEWI